MTLEAAGNSLDKTNDASNKLILPLTAATLFLSAFLLFSVQPFFAKMVLPRLGGTPAVWSIAMVFFQTALLAGYGYAHVLTRYLSFKSAVIVHIAVLFIALIALPIAIPASWTQPPADGEALWLIGLFTVSVGLPFFAVSANGPLLQAWFAKTGHYHAQDPYFLYGASNIGSFASLLLYVVLIEPLFDLGGQSHLWTGGFILLGLSIALCGYFSLKLSSANKAALMGVSATETSPQGLAITWPLRLTWIAYAFIPSALLVAVTAHISTDIAAAPFLWIVPLALFLLTFVIVFHQRPILKYATMQRIMPFLVVPMLFATLTPFVLPVGMGLPLHFLTFFVVAMTAHGALAEKRPGSHHLTEFYFAMSIGGVLGGIFASLVAMYLFTWIAEYPLLLQVSLFVLPRMRAVNFTRQLMISIVVTSVLIAGLLVLHKFGYFAAYESLAEIAVVNFLLLIAAVYFLFREPKAVVSMGLAMFVNTLVFMEAFNLNGSARSFFGVVRVVDNKETNIRLFQHGTTLHGAMRLADALPSTQKPTPLTYYTTEGGLNTALVAARKNAGGTLAKIAVIGVGAGSLACQAVDGEQLDLVEIDPLVIKIAQDPQRFRFLSACAPDANTIIGDGRLVLADKPDASYDSIILDAFSSDSIPVHLMTTEALGLFMQKLKPGGLLIMHITNRHLELPSVVAANARALGLVAVDGIFGSIKEGQSAELSTSSHVAILAKNAADFGVLAQDPRWKTTQDIGTKPWSDAYSNILAAMWRMQSK